MVWPKSINHVAQHAWVKGDGVKVKPFQISGRFALDDRAAIGTRAIHMIHASPVVCQITTRMRQQHFQFGIALHHTVKNQMADCNGGV